MFVAAVLSSLRTWHTGTRSREPIPRRAYWVSLYSEISVGGSLSLSIRRPPRRAVQRCSLHRAMHAGRAGDATTEGNETRPHEERNMVQKWVSSIFNLKA